MAEGSYFRVYYEDLMKNHPDVWFDQAALYTFNHLLALADKLWPTPAELPRRISKAGLDRCVKSKIITVTGFTFSVKGLDKQRQARQRQTQAGRDKLADERASTDPSSEVVTPSVTDTVTPHVRARGRSALVGDVLPNEEKGNLRANGAEDDFGKMLHLVERLAHRTFGNSPGSRVWTTLTEDLTALGYAKLSAAYQRTAARLADEGTPFDCGGLVFAAHKELFPIPDAPRRLSAAERKVDEREKLKREWKPA